MEAFYSTGLILFSWPMVTLTLLIDYVWVMLCYAFCLAVAGAKSRWAAVKSRFFAVFVTSCGADALLAAVLLAVLAVAQSNVRAATWLEHPFTNPGSTLTTLGCILAVALCGLLKWALYSRIVFKRLEGLETRQTRTLSMLLAFMTTPWTFLLPTVAIGTWLGEIMVAIGGLAGNASLESIENPAVLIP